MKWINRKDQQPNEEKEIIIWDKFSKRCQFALYTKGYHEDLEKWCVEAVILENDCFMTVEFDYWMPIPERPEEMKKIKA